MRSYSHEQANNLPRHKRNRSPRYSVRSIKAHGIYNLELVVGDSTILGSLCDWDGGDLGGHYICSLTYIMPIVN